MVEGGRWRGGGGAEGSVVGKGFLDATDEKKGVMVDDGSVEIKEKVGTKKDVSVDCEISREMADEIS